MILDTINRIIAQLPSLREKYKINKPIHYAYFHDEPYNGGSVYVELGEIDMGDDYRFIFNVEGELRYVQKAYWPINESIQYNTVWSYTG